MRRIGKFVLLAAIVLGAAVLLYNLALRFTLAREVLQTPRDPETGILRGAEPFAFSAPGAAACLLIHGFSATPQEMRSLGRRLAREGYEVEGPLLPGHGTKPQALAETRWTDWYVAVEQRYRSLRQSHRKIYVIGASTGALLALHLAAYRPVDGLVLLSPNLFLKARWLHLLDLEQFTETVGRLIQYVPRPVGHINDRAARKHYIAYNHLPVSALRTMLALMEVVRPELPRVTAPSLIIQSRGDQTVSPEGAEFLQAHLGTSQVELHWLTRSNHVVTLDYERELVEAEVIRFVAALKGS